MENLMLFFSIGIIERELKIKSERLQSLRNVKEIFLESTYMVSTVQSIESKIEIYESQEGDLKKALQILNQQSTCKDPG